MSYFADYVADQVSQAYDNYVTEQYDAFCQWQEEAAGRYMEDWFDASERAAALEAQYLD